MNQRSQHKGTACEAGKRRLEREAKPHQSCKAGRWRIRAVLGATAPCAACVRQSRFAIAYGEELRSSDCPSAGESRARSDVAFGNGGELQFAPSRS